MAALVLLVSLLVSGSQTGTIVIEKIALTASATRNGQINRPVAFSTTLVTQTAANGTLERQFASGSFYRSGDQQVYTPQGGIELYDAGDNRIFETTQSAVQRALDAQALESAPKGSHVSTGVGRVQHLSLLYAFAPGRRSIFEQGVLAHQYRIAGHALIDGREALRLIQSRSRRAVLEQAAHSLSTDITVYVTPRTLDPIEEVMITRLPGVRSRAVQRWLVYRVLPATSGNSRLLSLSARHPHARIIRGAQAYLRAGQSQAQTVSWTTTTG